MNKEHILSHLDFKTFYTSELPNIKWLQNGEGIALCCFHDDTKPSLSVNSKTGLYFCHACNEKGNIFSFYQKKHDVDFPIALKELGKQAGLSSEAKKKIVKVYDYKNVEGKLIFQVVRYDSKGFSQRRPDGKCGWVYNLHGITPVPYNLPEIIKSDYTFIVEGEKDVESLRELGLVASCNPMGAGKWRIEYNQYFKGKRVYIIPDNDKAGREHASQVAKNLKDIAEVIKVIELSGLPDKGDITDWIEALRVEGKTEKEIKEELQNIIKNIPEWTEPEKKESDLLSCLLKWNDILSLDIRTEYLLSNLIPKGGITLLFGRGGIGKTSLCLQIARAIAEGIPYGELQTIKTPVYYIDFENPLSVLKQRVENIGHTDNLWVWHISNTPMPPRLDSKGWELYRGLPPGLLIFDTLRAVHLSDENDSQDMAVVISRLKELREAGFTILLLHHTPKSNEGIYKGSTALLDLVDHVLSIEEVKDDTTIEFDTDNVYRLGVRIKTRYEPHHVFLKFNPEIKGFEVAKDPDLEKIETLYDVLRDVGQLKQKEFKERAKIELDFTEGEVRKLLRKGEGVAWDVKVSGSGKGNRGKIYTPKFDRMIGQHIYSHPINQSKPEDNKSLSNHTSSNSLQNPENIRLDDGINNGYPINQTGKDLFEDAGLVIEGEIA